MRRSVAPLVAAAALMAPTAAAAQWIATAGGVSAITASTMTNASGFVASCASASTVRLAWTPSPDVFVEGYQILRTQAGGPTAEILLPRAQASFIDTPPPARGQDVFGFTYTIRAGSTQHAWTTPVLAAPGSLTFTKSGCTAS